VVTLAVNTYEYHAAFALPEYADAAAARVISEWRDPAENMQAYIAYATHENQEKTVQGFILFAEKTLDAQPCIYLAQVAVLNRRHGIGYRLLKCVVNRYAIGTKFYLKFGFQAMPPEQIPSFGYGEQYCGFVYESIAVDA
jgi:hypothetical protein